MLHMDLGKLAYWARRIHRLSMWGVIVLGLIQMLTGMVLKFPKFLTVIPYASALQIQNLNSVVFSLFFAVSMITGLVMYFVPVILKRRQMKNQL